MQVYKAIKYIRLSYTDDKTVESDSVANQRRLIDDYIARHPEIEVVAEKIDDGYSGVLFDRPAFQEKLKIQMSTKRQEIEKTRRLIRGLYENFVQGILTNDEYFELKADYEHAINTLSGEIEVFEKSMDSLDNQLARYRAMEKDAKTLAQDHVLTAELIERLIERIEIDHERNIHVTFRFKNEFQGKAVEPCATM